MGANEFFHKRMIAITSVGKWSEVKDVNVHLDGYSEESNVLASGNYYDYRNQLTPEEVISFNQKSQMVGGKRESGWREGGKEVRRKRRDCLAIF